MEDIIIFHIKEHTLSINDKPLFNHRFEVFDNIESFKLFKKNLKFNSQSKLHRVKLYKDISKLGMFETGTSICNGQEWRWIRGLTNIINEFNDEFIYLDEGY